MDDQPTITTGLGVTIPAEPDAAPRPQPARPVVRFGKRRYRGFAVLDSTGNLALGTLRGSADAALAAFRKWNPAVPGHPAGETVKRITVTIEPDDLTK